MKKILFLLIISFGFFPSLVFAGNDITITCNSGDSECTVSPNLPIFNEANIYPGYTTSQKFFVDNNRTGACNLTLKAVSADSNLDLLSQKIFLDITGTNNENDLNISHYRLSDLLNSAQPSLSLGHVNKNKKNSYLWTILLDQSADNNYQNLSSRFDIKYQFECDENSTDVSGNVLGTSDGGTSGPGPSQCTNPAPLAPTGLYATEYDGGTVTLHWNNTTSPSYTGYLIAFGTSPGVYQYGSPDIGKDDHYTVRGLTPGAQYCFYVRSLNGCMPGERTPEYCLNPGSNIVAAATVPTGLETQVLGTNTSDQNPSSASVSSLSSEGQVLGETDISCTVKFLPLIFLIALIINLILVNLSGHWLFVFIISAIAFAIDFFINKNSCCFGQKWLCNYYFIGDLVSFLIPFWIYKKIKS